MTQWYPIIKQFHITLVSLSIILFFFRALLTLKHWPWQQRFPWLKVTPHILDSFLLASGVTLAVMSHQYPLVVGWITLKLLLLFIYIGLGVYVLKIAKNTMQRLIGIGLVALVLAWMIQIALTKTLWIF
ncbi:MAG: hypothetical protein COW84_02895 [Gammaproteobacteria bacterium CG22_combo_CG10-13_8_21_14_all_40_8]|nr:MAG: hypothetical protein COW84_02895 [Gammaproteobacteria bacterium CG22_combo_CG10-13_8_21_14_all_40_8]